MAFSRDWSQSRVRSSFRPKPPSLRIGKELSRGAYGSVHEGQLDGQKVAVKRIHGILLKAAKSQGESETMMDSFHRECQLLKEVDHPHVVEFKGAYYDKETDEPILVMELMAENLLQYLERNRGQLSCQKQLLICVEIVRGIRFLHTRTPPIVHRDLTDKNVLLAVDGLVKIADLGQFKLNIADYFFSTQPGAVPFMPPEALQPRSHYNEKLDMFSLGVLMLEIATQHPPGVNLIGIGRDQEVLRRKDDLSKLDVDHPLKPLILSCLQDNPKERPDIVTVHTQLLALTESIQVILIHSHSILHS